MALTGSIKVNLNLTYSESLDLSTPSDVLALSKTQSWADGTGANQAQVLWHDTRTLEASATDDLDLASALLSAFGAVTFTKIKALYIEMTTATSGYTLQLGGDVASVPLFGAVADFLEIKAGGALCLTAPVNGYVVTGATGDILQIYNPSGGAVTYKIVILGEGSVA